MQRGSMQSIVIIMATSCYIVSMNRHAAVIIITLIGN